MWLVTTTTATVLAQAIYNEGIKNVAAGANPMVLKRGIERAVMRGQRTSWKRTSQFPETKLHKWHRFANDAEIGKIAGAMKDVVKMGWSPLRNRSHLALKEVVEGMRFDKGYASPYMITNADRMESEYSDAHILITDKDFFNPRYFALARKSCSHWSQEIVIIADDVDGGR